MTWDRYTLPAWEDVEEGNLSPPKRSTREKLSKFGTKVKGGLKTGGKAVVTGATTAWDGMERYAAWVDKKNVEIAERDAERAAKQAEYRRRTRQREIEQQRAEMEFQQTEMAARQEQLRSMQEMKRMELEIRRAEAATELEMARFERELSEARGQRAQEPPRQGSGFGWGAPPQRSAQDILGLGGGRPPRQQQRAPDPSRQGSGFGWGAPPQRSAQDILGLGGGRPPRQQQRDPSAFLAALGGTPPSRHPSRPSQAKPKTSSKPAGAPRKPSRAKPKKSPQQKKGRRP